MLLSVAVSLLTLYLLYLALEVVLHARNRRAIPVRIHVNGIRGKSSVTRLIAAGLRAGGYAAVAKTTGTLPRLIDTSGSETPIRRMGPSNLIEQAEVFSWARRRGAGAIVIECMAVRPDLQQVAERRFVQATIGVVTNIRADHLDVMGPTVSDVARALSSTAPKEGILFTAERDSGHLSILERACARRQSRVIMVPPPEDAGSLLEGFSYIEHGDNIALALAVCTQLGIAAETALAGMRCASPDPGALRMLRVQIDGRRLCFVNALAANDPDSTLAIWERVSTLPDVRAARDVGERWVTFVNTRNDRPHRSLQLAELLPRLACETFILAGGGAAAVARRARELGMPATALVRLDEAPLEATVEALLGEARPSVLVFAIGNVHGIGLDLATYFEELARAI